MREAGKRLLILYISKFTLSSIPLYAFAQALAFIAITGNALQQVFGAVRPLIIVYRWPNAIGRQFTYVKSCLWPPEPPAETKKSAKHRLALQIAQTQVGSRGCDRLRQFVLQRRMGVKKADHYSEVGRYIAKAWVKDKNGNILVATKFRRSPLRLSQPFPAGHELADAAPTSDTWLLALLAFFRPITSLHTLVVAVAERLNDLPPPEGTHDEGISPQKRLVLIGAHILHAAGFSLKDIERSANARISITATLFGNSFKNSPIFFNQGRSEKRRKVFEDHRAVGLCDIAIFVGDVLVVKSVEFLRPFLWLTMFRVIVVGLRKLVRMVIGAVNNLVV
ncbi:hypothetical protein HDU84_002080 [Entophlyctis sp. JEL0112]|nr:hypothetical protein HDU84_002080 [Entophlyctis sp. JEL0112]